MPKRAMIGIGSCLSLPSFPLSFSAVLEIDGKLSFPVYFS